MPQNSIVAKSRPYALNTYLREALRSHRFHWLRPTLHVLKSIIAKSNIWIIDGTEPSSGNNLRILYFGSDVHKNYIAHLFFLDNCHDISIGRYYYWSIPYIIKNNCANCSLIIIETNYLLRRIYQAADDFYIPLWLSASAAVPLVPNRKASQSDVRRIRNSRLECVVTNELSEFNKFYYSMYLPYLIQRHKDRAIVMDYEYMMHRVTHGECELLLIRKGNESIAGALLVFGEGLPKLWAMGIKDAAPAYLRDGAVAATYYFLSLYFRERGYDSMHVGFSRPFLTDGVFQYKSKWDVKVTGYSSSGFLLRTVSLPHGLKGLLWRSPFVYLEKGQVWGALFVEDLRQMTDKSLKRVQKEFFRFGVSGLSIYRCGEADDELDRSSARVFHNDGPVVKGRVEEL